MGLIQDHTDIKLWIQDVGPIDMWPEPAYCADSQVLYLPSLPITVCVYVL